MNLLRATSTTGIMFALAFLGARVARAEDPPDAPVPATDPDQAAAQARAEALDARVGELYAEAKYAEATPLAREALAIREAALGKDHPTLAAALGDLGHLLHLQGAYGEARPLLERALAIDEKALGKDHIDVATDVNNLAGLLYDAGYYAEALPLFERALTIDESALGKDHPRVADRLNNIALLLVAQGAYEEARPRYERALLIRENAFGKEHPAVAQSLNNLAVLLKAEGAYDEARPRYERALLIREKALGMDHPAVATSLNNLAVLLTDQGDYAGARPLHARAIAIREKTFGKEHPEVAQSLNNLAEIFLKQGAYGDARVLFERALAIQEKVLGSDHPSLATSLSNLATVLRGLGAYAEALPLCERALAIQEKTLGSGHPSVANSLNNLAVLHQSLGAYAEARALSKRALDILEKALGMDHPAVAMSLNNRASLLQDQGAYAEAQVLYERALAILAKTYGENHPDVAKCLSNLASVFRDQQAYADARPLYERARATLERVLGKDHPDLATILGSLAALLQEQGAYAEARPLFERALAMTEAHARGQLSGLTARERLVHRRSTRYRLDNWLGFAPKAGLSGYPELLRLKGLVTRAEAAERRLERAAGPDAEERIQALRMAEHQVAQLANAVPSSSNLQAHERWQGKYAQALRLREALVLALSRDYAPLRTGLERIDLGVQDIQASLGKGQALVDLLRSDGRYLAFVVGRTGDVIRLDLGEAPTIEQAAVSFVQANQRYGIVLPAVKRGLTAEGPEEATDTEVWHAAGRTLRELVFAPIEARLPVDTRTLYIVPDAALAAVPFAALPGRTAGQFLIDEYMLVHLSMAQDLVPWKGAAPLGEGTLLVGGVDFEKADAQESAVAPLSPPPHLAMGGDRAPGDRGFTPLLGTTEEVAALGARLGAHVMSLRGAQATEGRVRAGVKDRRFLHFATHGFVLEDLMLGMQLTKNDERKWMAGSGEHRLAAGHDPMVLCGLALAGANPREGGGEDDGILTAAEASHLDLGGCDLVVLSACETAKGTPESGEGVLGLVQGFHLAGARHVVGSLWKVDDDGTRRLMERFYEGLLRQEKPLPPAQALREAALWLRAQKGPNGQSFSAPRYWAAFVAYGK